MHAGGVAESHGHWNDEKDPLEELVSIPTKSRDWKGIFISLLVIVMVGSMVKLTIRAVTPPPGPPRSSGHRMVYDQIRFGTFSPNRFNATWVSGSKLAFINQNGGLSVFDILANTTKEIQDNTTFRSLNTATFSVSSNMTFLVLSYDEIPLFRYSKEARYRYIRLGERDPMLSTILGGELVQSLTWVGDMALLVVKNNDIYYLPNLSKNDSIRLTDSGREGLIYNGVTDWLYEEEILYTDSAIWVSPGLSVFAFASFNDSLVAEYLIPSMTGRWAPVGLRYPTAGGTNPEVTLTVMQLLSAGVGKQWRILPPQEVFNSSWYIGSVTWASESVLSVAWLPRSQTSIYYSLCPPPSYQCKTVAADVSFHRPKAGWVQNHGTPVFSEDAARMAVIMSTDQGDMGYFPHLVVFRVSVSNSLPSLPIELSRGRFEVTKINTWDYKNKIIYFTATLEDSPGERHLFSVPDNGGEDPQCLTCPKETKKNESSEICLYTEAHISSSSQAFVQHCLGPGIPFSLVRSLPDNQDILSMDQNSRLRQVVNQTALPQTRFLTIHLPPKAGGQKAQLQILLPPGYRDDDKIAFPTIFQIYGGPSSQMVSHQWRVDWDSFLSSSKGYVFIYLDVRGSGYQGDSHRKVVHRHLSKAEVDDVLYVIRESLHLPFVDSSRMAVWGWSYGGYLATKILANDAKNEKESLLKCGVAVAPVSKWQFYDSAYTERYMGMPDTDDNWEGYDRADLTKSLEYLSDNKLLLVHGTADDNVHLTHSMFISRALVDHGILFKQMIYPDENHGLSGVLPHLHSTMESFFTSCLGNVTLLSPSDAPYTLSDVDT